MDYIIDRFEGKFAVCEKADSEDIVNIEINLISDNVREGDVITFKSGYYVFDEEKTNNRKNAVKRKFDTLWS